MAKDRTLVSFRSEAFNTTTERDTFINPENYGDDLARWIMDGLRRNGYQVEDGPGQEDHGWYFTFHCGDTTYDFIVGWADGEWIGWVERRVGFLASLLGRRGHGIRPEAIQAIQDVLSGSADISDVRWHTTDEFARGQQDG